ncbi:MAG: hypothetical protein II223_02285 [Treponema sp.]|nr:hypothetical protein [Treponema sp.]
MNKINFYKKYLEIITESELPSEDENQNIEENDTESASDGSENDKEVHATIKTLVMNFVEARGEATRTEIVKFICDIKGLKYDPVSFRGYWSDAFNTGKFRNSSYQGVWKRPDRDVETYTGIGYFMKPSSKEPRYLIQEKPYGPYKLATK